MAWVKANPNPKDKQVPDCVVRAISIALNKSWYDVFDDLYIVGRADCNMLSADAVWGRYLVMQGCTPFLLPRNCPHCLSISEFTKVYSNGTYIIGTGGHAVAVIDGDYYDSWDSGNEIASFFWKVTE